MRNPFETSMTRMQLPEGVEAITVEGFQMELDAERCFNVPQRLVKECEGHGAKVVGPKNDKVAEVQDSENGRLFSSKKK